MGRRIRRRASTAARGVSRSIKESRDVGAAEDSLEALQAELAELQEELRRETEALALAYDPQLEKLETVTVRPKKRDVTVELTRLAWAPHWLGPAGSRQPAWE
jgi:hypothetical protein